VPSEAEEPRTVSEKLPILLSAVLCSKSLKEHNLNQVLEKRDIVSLLSIYDCDAFSESARIH